MNVDAFVGNGLVNSFAGGDKSTGTLTSPPFKIGRRYLSFLIGGGGYSNETCMNLLVDGKVVRTATGLLEMSAFLARDAVIEIVDQRTGG